MFNSVSGLCQTGNTIGQRLLVNVRLDAEMDAQDSVNTHRLDVWCFYEVSRAFDSAVGLGTFISDVQLPPPESRKVAHIPPNGTFYQSIRLFLPSNNRG